jgi:hypothetical protein
MSSARRCTLAMTHISSVLRHNGRARWRVPVEVRLLPGAACLLWGAAAFIARWTGDWYRTPWQDEFEFDFEAGEFISSIGWPVGVLLIGAVLARRTFKKPRPAVSTHRVVAVTRSVLALVLLAVVIDRALHNQRVGTTVPVKLSGYGAGLPEDGFVRPNRVMWLDYKTHSRWQAEMTPAAIAAAQRTSFDGYPDNADGHLTFLSRNEAVFTTGPNDAGIAFQRLEPHSSHLIRFLIVNNFYPPFNWA